METGSLLPQMLFLLILIGVNAFFAASEIAIISLNNQKVKRQAEEGDERAKLLLGLIDEPSRFLATIQVGVTLSGLLASAVASESFADQLTDWAVAAGVPLDRGVMKLLALVGITLVLSYFTLVLGELVPKRLAMQQSEKISRLAVKPLGFLAFAAGPFVKFLSISTNFVIRALGGDPAAHEERITEEEIRLMVDVGQEKGIIQSTEKEMIDNIFEFDNTAVSAVMTHRTEVVALPLEASLEEVLGTVIKEKFSRLPVYQESIDNIVGILHVQDLIPVLKNPTRAATSFNLKKIIRQPYFVPFAKKTDELFKELQKKNNHMAVVIDEYGGTAGIVTIEDLIEEIVGNIFDEHDEVVREIEKLDERSYLVEGTVSMATVNEVLDIELPTDDSDTLGGFVMAELGRIPAGDETPSFEYAGLSFQVMALEDKRISKVKITKPI
ncbi:putative hemolysin [Hydrogenispora ethanolica]|uniref:Putative hemolysin n=1 Tax=Hydrogenispora ethanolica TaxID=1082276 RepID=A0A4R1S1I2_HYDET|nr:putative hemolysin [Hydrogenispora ethanolica]